MCDDITRHVEGEYKENVCLVSRGGGSQGVSLFWKQPLNGAESLCADSDPKIFLIGRSVFRKRNFDPLRMNDSRKHGKKEEHNKPQGRGRVEYGMGPYSMNENMPEGFGYPPQWVSPGMNYPFDQQYNYYTGPVGQFGGPGLGPQGFGQEQVSVGTGFEKSRAKSHGKKKIKLEYIRGKNKRSVTFSKRKKGIMKKAYELNILTGTEILLLVASESGHVYTFATDKLKPIILEHENIIQSCLNRQDVGEYRRPGKEEKTGSEGMGGYPPELYGSSSGDED